MELYKQMDDHVAPEGFLYTGEIRVPREGEYWQEGSDAHGGYSVPGGYAMTAHRPPDGGPRVGVTGREPATSRHILARVSHRKMPDYPKFRPGDFVRIEPMDRRVEDSPGFSAGYMHDHAAAYGKYAKIKSQDDVGVMLEGSELAWPPTKLTKLELLAPTT